MELVILVIIAIILFSKIIYDLFSKGRIPILDKIISWIK